MAEVGSHPMAKGFASGGPGGTNYKQFDKADHKSIDMRIKHSGTMKGKMSKVKIGQSTTRK